MEFKKIACEYGRVLNAGRLLSAYSTPVQNSFIALSQLESNQEQLKKTARRKRELEKLFAQEMAELVEPNKEFFILINLYPQLLADNEEQFFSLMANWAMSGKFEVSEEVQNALNNPQIVSLITKQVGNDIDRNWQNWLNSPSAKF